MSPATLAATPPFADRVRGLLSSPISELDTLLEGRVGIIPLAGGTPHPSDVPAATIAAIAATVAERDAGVLSYGLSNGDEHLREAILASAERFGDGTAGPEELIVTSGAMQALDLLAKLFVNPGDLVLVESPTFTDALATFSQYEASVVPVPMDEHGMAVEEIPGIVERVGRPPKLLYVVPTFQNPAGVTTTVERRRQIAAAAARYGAIVIDDDPYRLLRYRGEAIPSLRALTASDGDVVSLRSASKLIAPGLRVGWALGPARVIAQMVKAKQGMDVCTSNLTQRIVAEFMGGDELGRHIARLRERNALRLAATTSALEHEFAGTGVRWRTPDGGYFLWLDMPGSRHADRLLPLALDEGVSFVPGRAFSPTHEFSGSLRLCFASQSEDQLAEGVRRLRVAYAGLEAGE